MSAPRRAYFQIGFNRCGTLSLYRFFPTSSGFVIVKAEGSI